MTATGTRVGFTYNGATYHYLTNAQGDVTGITDVDDNLVVEYSYDAWGKLLNMTDSSGDAHIGQKNSFLYRGYYYDSETGLYYLNSRYCDPQTGRFINADGLVSTGQGVLGNNIFAYCLNNPVNFEDANGEMAAVAGALAWGMTAGDANAWNPAGWIILGVTVAAVAIWVIPWDSVGRSISNGWNQAKSSAISASISL